MPTIRYVKRYHSRINDIYADTESMEIDWLGRVLEVFLIIAVLFVVLKVVLDNEEAKVVFSILATFFWMSIAWYISRMRRSDNVVSEEVISENENVNSSPNLEGKAERQDAFLRELRQVLLKDRLFASSDLTRDVVARKMNTNYTYLTRDLREATGLKFSTYVTQIRMEEAARLLKTTDMTVNEVLFTCGYQSKSTFYRLFTEEFQCTPVEYRARQ